MRRQRKASAAAIALGGIALLAQAAASAQGAYKVPRTSWGDPDLEGLWPSTAMVGVPLQRPKQFGNRLYLTDEEFAARKAAAASQHQRDLEDIDVTSPPSEIGTPGSVGSATSPPPHWLERGEPQRQSSLLVDPADGQLPPMTAEGEARQKAQHNTYLAQSGFKSYTDLGAYDRCISRGPLGSMMPVIYNDGNEFVQAPGYVAFRNEMIHETRVIPLDGSPHVAPAIRSYMGDSRGHFAGDTLVVETTNLNGRTGAQANGEGLVMSEAAKLVERFTRTSENTMQYEVTVEDPKTWTKPWTARFELKRDPSYGMYEYACHEGNHALRNVLSASRAEEQQAAGHPSPRGR